MIQGQQQVGFDELGLNHRAPDGDDGLVREDGRPFRHRPYVAGKAEVPEIREEILTEQPAAAQVCDILLRKGQMAQIAHHLLDSGHDGHAAAVRNMPEKHIEIGDLVAEPVLQEPVGHGQLIKIGQHGQVVRAIGLMQGIHIDRLLLRNYINRFKRCPGRAPPLRFAWSSVKARRADRRDGRPRRRCPPGKGGR